MKLNQIIIIVFVLVLTSCDGNRRPVMKPKDELAMFARRFCLFDHESLNLKANEFIFSKSGRFQRSFIIVVKVTEGRRRLLFQEIDFDARKDENNDLHFRGCSFDLDDQAWNELLERSNKVCNESSKNGNYGDVLDGNSYIISRKGIICGYNFGQSDEENEYERFSEFVLTLVDNLGSLKTMN